jgi:hypothetical protein
MASHAAAPSSLEVPAARQQEERRSSAGPLAVARIAPSCISDSQPTVAFATAMHCGLKITAKANHHVADKTTTQALRINPMRRTDCVERKVQLGDRLSLFSNGLTKVVADIRDRLVIKLLGHAEAVNHRVEMALARGALNNVSVAAGAAADSEAV